MSFALHKMDKKGIGIIHLASFPRPTGLAFLWPGCWLPASPRKWGPPPCTLLCLTRTWFLLFLIKGSVLIWALWMWIWRGAQENQQEAMMMAELTKQSAFRWLVWLPRRGLPCAGPAFSPSVCMPTLGRRGTLCFQSLSLWVVEPGF